MGKRKGDLLGMTPMGSRYRLEFLVPSRGLFGYRNEFLTDTRGEGVMSSVLDSYAPMKGEIERRQVGSLVAFETGEAWPMVSRRRRSGARCSSAPARRFTPVWSWAFAAATRI